MHTTTNMILGAVFAGLTTGSALAAQFVVELPMPLEAPSQQQLDRHNVTLDQAFSAGADSYAVFTANDESTLQKFLGDTATKAEKISAVLFVNSPEYGGGKAAGKTPREGHQIFMIERSVPGVGNLPTEKLKEISQGSNAANTKLGNIIEWDHSYLTSEGTYCVYRADSPATVREQGAISGAPISKITAVQQQSYQP